MNKMAQTLTGQWSNLMDNLKSLIGNTGQAINDTIKNLLAKVNGWFDANRAEIQKTTASLFAAIGSILDTILGVLATFGSVFGSVLDAVTGYTQGTTKAQGAMWRQLFMYIANAVAAIGAVISIMIRGIAVSIGTAWNIIQMTGQAIVSTLMTVIAGAFSPIQWLLNKIIGGINIVRQAIGKTAYETITFSQDMFGAAMDSMKQSAAENGKDIADLINTASEGMANDINTAIGSMDKNWNSLNANIDETGKNTKSLGDRINGVLGDMKGSLNGVAGAHGNAA